jgi:XTP/dITP diphosphohydrolase
VKVLAKRWQNRVFVKRRKSHGEADTSPSAKRTLWFVTQNPHKYQEARRTLDPFGIKIRLLASPKTEIQSTNLEEIAKFAAEEAAKKHDRTVVVEDSGLFVRALNGFPGPFSSYVHETLGVEGLLRLMSRKTHREANFQASLALASPKDSSRQFSGKVYGTITHKSAGTGGFGFDPVFIPNGARKTFAQGGSQFKDQYSHRAIAFRKLALWYIRAKV